MKPTQQTDNIRRQLTLFLDTAYSGDIERIRKKYNPIQYNLIKSHVTVCREDELKSTGRIISGLNHVNLKKGSN